MKKQPLSIALTSRLDGLLNGRKLPATSHAIGVTAHPRGVAQRGFDLIQIAIVVGVIGILMAGAFVGVPAVMAGVRATSEGQDLHSYVVGQQAMIEHGAITDSSVVANKLYNTEQVRGGKIYNRFGGSVDISAADGSATLLITSKGIPARACEKLVPIVAGLFEVVKVGNTEVKNISAQDESAKIALTRALVNTACNSAGGPVDIVYTGTR